MIFALILFALTYMLILSFGKYRTYIALASGVYSYRYAFIC